MTGVRTVLIAQVVLIYMQAIETIRQKHVWCNAGANHLDRTDGFG